MNSPSTSATPPSATRLAIDGLKQQMSTVIRGKLSSIELLVATLIAGESILIQDVPGVGKTTLAKSLAACLDLEFQRIQCTPDLLPSDIFGVSIFHPQESEFRFRRGPIFTNVLLVDEINRASPRTQSALLEAMAERQVTVEGKTYRLESPFMVIATQNPIEHQGTYPLPESQLDRFAMQISLDYPDRETELELLYAPPPDVDHDVMRPILHADDVENLQASLEAVQFDRGLGDYLLQIVEATRAHPDIELGCSPRGAICFFRCVKAWAMVKGRDYVLPDDIQFLAAKILGHRLVARGSVTQQGAASSEALVGELVDQIDVPV